MKKKTIGEFFREKREAAGMSLREVAKASGISHGHIDDIEAGNKMPSFDRVINLLNALHVDPHEFLQETGYLPTNVEPASMGKLRQIPVVSWVIAGKWKDVCDSFQPGDADEWIESDVKGQNVFALRVKGDSMEPEFIEGDLIVINPHVKPNHNDYVIVRNDEGEATLKQLKKYGRTRVLHPLNPKYKDIELSEKHQYVIVGKVVEKKKRY
jgi:SOS-response transcriptional repressor LexA